MHLKPYPVHKPRKPGFWPAKLCICALFFFFIPWTPAIFLLLLSTGQPQHCHLMQQPRKGRCSADTATHVAVCPRSAGCQYRRWEETVGSGLSSNGNGPGLAATVCSGLGRPLVTPLGCHWHRTRRPVKAASPGDGERPLGLSLHGTTPATKRAGAFGYSGGPYQCWIVKSDRPSTKMVGFQFHGSGLMVKTVGCWSFGRAHKGTTVNFIFFKRWVTFQNMWKEQKFCSTAISIQLFRQTLFHLEQITYLK
jgi:hypothetical protein